MFEAVQGRLADAETFRHRALAESCLAAQVLKRLRQLSAEIHADHRRGNCYSHMNNWLYSRKKEPNTVWRRGG
jgi:hypothetical protein